MWVIEISKFCDRKRKAICVYDTENPVAHYVVGYIDHHEELFKKALEDSRNIIYVNEKVENDEHKN